MPTSTVGGAASMFVDQPMFKLTIELRIGYHQLIQLIVLLVTLIW